jgi:hypothetical protein
MNKHPYLRRRHQNRTLALVAAVCNENNILGDVLVGAPVLLMEAETLMIPALPQLRRNVEYQGRGFWHSTGKVEEREMENVDGG